MFRALCHFPPDLLSSAGDKGEEPSLLIRIANVRNVSFQSLYDGSIYLINLVDKSKVLRFASPPTQHHRFSRN